MFFVSQTSLPWNIYFEYPLVFKLSFNFFSIVKYLVFIFHFCNVINYYLFATHLQVYRTYDFNTPPPSCYFSVIVINIIF